MIGAAGAVVCRRAPGGFSVTVGGRSKALCLVYANLELFLSKTGLKHVDLRFIFWFFLLPISEFSVFVFVFV